MNKRITLLLLSLLFIFSNRYVSYADEPVKLPGETVTASADREDTSLLSPGTVTVVKPEQLKGEQKNLPEILKRVPGLHVIEAKGRGAYTVASVRGSTAAEVSVFVDGVLMNIGSEAAVDLTTIPVENVERIEVYRGYVPARFAGASMGGVINIITKKPKKSGQSLELGAGEYGLLKASLSYNAPLGRGKFLFGSSFEQNDGDFKYLNDYNMPYTPSVAYETDRQNNWYRNADVLLKWNDDHWQVRGGWKRNDRELPYVASGFDRPNSLKGATMLTDQADFSVGRRQKNGSFEWGFRAEYLHQSKKYDNDNNAATGAWGEQHNKFVTNRYAFALDGSYALGKNNFLEFLGDYSKEDLDVNGDVVTRFGGITNFTREAGDLQLQDTINLDKNGSFTLVPIIRGNWWAGTGKFSAGLALNKEFNSHWNLKVTGGTYNRSPNLYELYGDGAFVLSNPKLDWETGTQWDLSATWKNHGSKSDVSATLTYFGRSSDNLIEFVMINPRYGKYFNIGKADINGIELETLARINKWDIHLSATWMDAKNKSDDYRKDAPLPNRPEYEALLRISRNFLKDDAASAFVELHYTGENYYDYTGAIKMDNYMTTGIGLKYSFSKHTKLVLGVNDLFNESPDVKMFTVLNGPSRTMWYPMQGRTFYASFIWDF